MKKLTKKQIDPLKLTSFDELLDQNYGKKGTSKREAYEAAFKEELICEISKQIRGMKNITRDGLISLFGGPEQ